MSDGKRRFKLEFRFVHIRRADGSNGRAAIIAVAPIPGSKGWLNAVLAVDDGTMRQQAISELNFQAAERNQLVMIEVEDEIAAPVLYVPQGTGL